ncbi:MAG TPA: hypothetical protein VJZ71_18915 [Phycisphaerae bacterium]|nr:hypothetical protein [Phycisphaerae bacterium]
MTQRNPLMPGGIVHTYLGYDPVRFPMPAAEAPDLVSPAFEHMLAYGSLGDLTPKQLAEAVEIDPSQIAGLGPSLSSLLAMLEERRRRILETYETTRARSAADEAYRQIVQNASVPPHFKKQFDRAVRDEQVIDLERLWYQADVKEIEPQAFASQLLQIIERLGEKYEVEKLASKYPFTGRQPMEVPNALEIKEELETIDRLIQQLKEAARNAKLYVVNMDELARFASEEQMESLEAMRRQVEELLRHLAEEQGLRDQDGRYSLTPKAFKIFQTKLLDRIFADLSAAKAGRHQQQITGEGAVELQRTKPYEFGDSLANMDVPGSLMNAMIREKGKVGIRNADRGMKEAADSRKVRVLPEDIEIHLTRNTPKCATVVCMDMSGSMRYGGQYINVKRMALALHGLIRTEYPGDFVDFVEIYTLAKRRHISEVLQLLPKPVTIYDSRVRLKADLSDERVTEHDLPPHFTNLQQGLALARQILQGQDTPNRQIILITDGLPTAHFEKNWLYLLYPPDHRTETFTLREGLLCRQQGITINTFLLSSWGQTEDDVRFAYRLSENTQGRVFFVGGRELDRFVVWDYLQRRRFLIG